MAQIVGYKLRNYAPVLDYCYAVASGIDFGEYVAGKQNGLSARLFFVNKLNETLLHKRVESAGRFVQNKNLRMHCHDGSQIENLFLSAG